MFSLNIPYESVQTGSHGTNLTLYALRLKLFLSRLLFLDESCRRTHLSVDVSLGSTIPFLGEGFKLFIIMQPESRYLQDKFLEAAKLMFHEFTGFVCPQLTLH